MARSWLSVLEASYIVFRLPPSFANLGKKLIKALKLYFLGYGLPRLDSEDEIASALEADPECLGVPGDILFLLMAASPSPR